MRIRRSPVAALVCGILLAAPIPAQLTQRVSVATRGAAGNGDSNSPSISADGRYVAFGSEASNFVPGDGFGLYDIFVHDRVASVTARISQRPDGTPANDNSIFPLISADGRFVAFLSYATNLVPGDTNGEVDVFVHDRVLHTTERVSVSSTGEQANDSSSLNSISADGRFVAFHGESTNLVTGDTNGFVDIFVRDRQSGTTERVNVSSGGVQANFVSYDSELSADGRFVAFGSAADNLVPGDANANGDIFIRDRLAGTTELVSVNSAGIRGNGGSGDPVLSADGSVVAFSSTSTNFDPLDTDTDPDLYVRDFATGVTELASQSSGGIQANSASWPAGISADGRRILFSSFATNLVVPGDTNHDYDVFVRDLRDRTTVLVSVSPDGAYGNAGSYGTGLSADGRYAGFWGNSSNLVEGDDEDWYDAFLRDLDAAGFTSLCDPGSDGVVACPCANAPSGPGRGCENSSATGGAVLAASGIAYLSEDSLVFTTSGEKPSALSIVMQGNGVIASGAVYGQGVRCVGGTILRRLFVAQASGGSITAPDFGAGDPTISARSAAKGDLIQAGQSRWYLVYYRDPIVLGSCPASRTFNATQTGRIDWSL